MNKISKPIVFFGSGPVAAASLRLLAQDFNIECVITKPRPEHHRGDVPVLSLAQKLNLKTETASNRKELDKLFASRDFESPVGVLIDFGIIISTNVINYFPLGIVNSHFSVLPEWRGADPITFALLSGQQTTGVSLMLLTEGMDEGPLISFTEYDIPPDATTPQLTKDLIELSHAQIKSSLPDYLAGKHEPMPQTITSRKVSYSRKISKQDGILDWSKPAEQLEREVRAFQEWPKSYTTFNGLDVIVTKAEVSNESGLQGKTAVINKEPAVYCAKHALILKLLKPAGKKEMTGEAFLAGYKKIFLN